MNQWDIHELLKKHHNRWFTVKELLVMCKIKLTATSQFVMCRKLRKLCTSGFVVKRKCFREVAWTNEDEYKVKQRWK